MRRPRIPQAQSRQQAIDQGIAPVAHLADSGVALTARPSRERFASPDGRARGEHRRIPGPCAAADQNLPEGPWPDGTAAALIEHAGGRAVAYIDATAIAVFTYQDTDGTYVIDICTRVNCSRQTRVLLDGHPLIRNSSCRARCSRAAGET